MSIQYIGRNKAKLVVSIGSRESRKTFTKTVEISGKKDAERKYISFEEEIKGGTTTNMSVGDLLEWYINGADNSSCRATTIHGYNSIKKALSLSFKGRKAKDITTYHIDRYITAELKSCSPKTIKNRVSLLSAAYKKAQRNGILSNNPCELATLPRQKKADVKVIDDNLLPKYLDALSSLEDTDIKVAVEFALFCGLRMSEILALTKEDIDLKERFVSVNKSRHYVDGKEIIQPPKTESSYRIVAMPDFMVEDIKKLYREHDDYIQQDIYIIQNRFGESAKYIWVIKNYHKFLEENDLPLIHPHELRHTHASILIKNGFEVVEVSHQLGHSQTSTTLNVYSHLLQDASAASRKAADVFSEKWASNGHPL